MSYSIGYCRVQINACQRTLKILKEDLSKLRSIIDIINESGSSYKEAVADLEVAKDILSSGFRGNTARNHEKNIGRLMDLCKEDNARLNLIKVDTAEKQADISKRISNAQTDLAYWERQLIIAETEAAHEE